MSRKLRAEDARVVDMLLDSGNFATDRSVPQVFSQTEMLDNRFGQVEKVLKLLDQMPVVDPPANLVARTMSFIDQSVQSHHPTSVTTSAQTRPNA
jgi:hypothetical protein